MSTRETVNAVSDPQPTVAAAIDQLTVRLNANMRDVGIILEREGEQLWTIDVASHTVTPVAGAAGILGARAETTYVASAIIIVTYHPDLT
ncbi:hypothetical protein SPF06_19520 [Sinomonas sp. JGH33]|uniref:Uncharacterized protein n=1 Tax=Sinomonas terricola TaxID=3110330 RepID=A0ABU5TB52_9MICC|nr:hypothetical protein [Sinomonas sp. JGH33]MEA5456918.1 hypothetical protein [Sinomonas sp. JGH33]